MRRGFTLVELMVAMAIVSLLLGLGVFQMVRWNQDQKLKAMLDQLKSDIAYCRQVAIQRGSKVPSMPDVPHPVISNVRIDEVTMQFASEPPLVRRSFDPPLTVLEGLSTGPDVTTTDLSKAVVVRAWYRGQAVPWVAAFDGSGRAVWQNTMRCTTGHKVMVLSLEQFTQRVTLVE